MNPRDIRNRFREQRYTSTDTDAVMKALADGDAIFLNDVVASYIKYAEKIDERALVQYLKIAQDFWPVHEIISGLSILRYRDSEFAAEVLRYARGVSWDKEDYAKIAAIAAIPRILNNGHDIQDILKAAVRSDNIVVRDSALEAAQAVLGVPLSKISVPAEVREWLGLKSSGRT